MVKIAHYPLQEDSGSTAYDHSGNGNDGTVNGAGPADTGTVSGLLGTTAYDFDGADDYISTVNLELSNASSFTISCWSRADSVHNGTIIGRYDGTDDIVHITVRDTNDYRFRLGHTGGNEYNVNAGSYNTGEWNHIALVFNSSTPEARIYQNGEMVANPSGAIDDFDTGSGPNIGRRSDNATYHDGPIADVRVYNHALTSSEVQFLYEQSQSDSFTTEVRSFADYETPDIDIGVTLNGNSGTVNIVGSPGTNVEEVNQVSLTSGTTTINWNQAHKDFRFEVTTDLASVTSRVEITRLELLP